MASIFVSYRREDSAGHAGRLFDQLKLRFGQKNVFWDVSGSIEPGEPFDGAIERAVASCDALLAIIGPTWVTSADAEGKRRIDDPHDFVRLEIGKALRRNVRVVPVLVHRATMPRMEELPGDLQPIARHQAIELSDSRWDHDVSQLIQSLDRKIGRQDWWQRLWRPIAVAAAVVFLSAGGVGLWVIQQERDTTPVVPQPSSAERTPSGEAVSRTPSRSQGDDTTGAPELVAVPDVERLPLDVARTRLAEAQLRVGQTSFYTLDRYIGRPSRTSGRPLATGRWPLVASSRHRTRLTAGPE
jgi:TIR domain